MTTTDPLAVIARRVRITGYVQGVGYRAWAAHVANRLGLDGWVRNRSDGSVELVAVGPSNKIDQFIEACRTGPRTARVDGVSIEDTPGIVAGGFIQKPTV